MATTGKRKSKGKGLVFLGILAGAAIGAAVALVYSPGKGEENRERLMQYISERAGVQ
jgi:gas vesicle protein